MTSLSSFQAAPAEPLTVSGHRLTLLVEGPQRLNALLALIDGARESLRLLYYTFAADQTAARVRDALVAAAVRGVKVSLLVDGFGSADASDRFFQPLAEGGGRFRRFEPRWGRRYLLRNHQKLALADGERVIIGGFNVSDDYFGSIESGAWRDIGLLVEGAAAGTLASYYDALFDWAEQPKARIRDLRRVLQTHSARKGPLQWLFGGPTHRLSPWARSVKEDMLRSKRLDLIAAYFAPSRSMIRRIYNVGRDGRARIVTAAKSDNRFTIGAARHSYWRLMRRGVEVYEYRPTKLHTKLIVLDGVVHIGSANFDMRSLYINLEMMLRIEDPAFAALLRGYVDHEVADSELITPEQHRAQRSLWNRFSWGVAHFIIATADYNLARRLNFGRADGEL
jgi:cardiolipin synthase